VIVQIAMAYISILFDCVKSLDERFGIFYKLILGWVSNN